MLRRLRTTLGDRPSPLSPPLSKYRWLRGLAYLVVLWLALFLPLAGGQDIAHNYGLTAQVGLATGLVQATAVVLALWRPVPAWLLSLSAVVVTALLGRESLMVSHSGLPRPAPLPGDVPGVTDGPSWPWTVPEMAVHVAVLLLLALRVPASRAVAALLVTGLTTYGLEGVLGADRFTGSGLSAFALSAVAVLVGTALRGLREARSQLVEQTTITAEERARRTLLEERSRIARELHDVVAHHMSVISIQAQVAPHLSENPSDELKENLAGIRQNALEALAELRRVLGVLRSPNPEDPYGLGDPGAGVAPQGPQPTLDRLGALVENTRAAGLAVVLETEDSRNRPLPYPPGVELSAYRIVQEALSNALRHAPGSTVRVEVTHIRDGLCLSVVNSRPRKPVVPSPGAGHGLLGMRERAAMLGGHVTAARTLHGGFAVTAFLPRDGTAPLADTGPFGLAVEYPDPAVAPVFVLDPPDTSRAPQETARPGPPPPTGEETP
ncbi:sensor histidine kinase [Streptomyces sp. NRRL S-340]|uniref:sensor histidine kinase n=1 Tax=Streptomyces sp. NRRL S-340 TaxID=1463901 RepID=UPI00056C11C4|nr:sensor histidine kinase [Streptomyces sp. NRRL S-340]